MLSLLGASWASAWLWLFWEAKNAPQDPSEIGEQEGVEG